MASKVPGQVDTAQWKDHCLQSVHMIFKVSKIYF